MSAILSFLMGYLLGVKAGPDAYAELQKAWKTIAKSEEVKGLVAAGVSMAGDLARQGGAVVAGRLAGKDEESPFMRAA